MTCQQRAAPVVVVPLAELLGVNGRLHIYPGMHEASLLPADTQPGPENSRSMGPPGPDPAPRRVAVPGPAERGSSVPQSVTGRPDGTLGERSPPPVPVRKTQIFGPF